MNLIDIITPLAVCVLLPVIIVWIVSRVRLNETNRKAEIMLKALENGVTLDPDLFKSNKKKATIKKDLIEKLNGACITSLMGAAFLILYFINCDLPFFPSSFLPLAGAVMLAVGIGLFISYFAGKKMLAKEIEVEEKELFEQK
jgi:small-conductance mechanosensitive channel